MPPSLLALAALTVADYAQTSKPPGNHRARRQRRRGVIVPWSISCGSCAPCAAGLTSKCAPARGDKPLAAFGFGDAIGGHGGMICDALRVPWADAMLVRVPAGVDPIALASASDNIPDAYRTVGPPLAQTPGAPVLIVGGSGKSIGLYAAGIAHALGSSRVDYLDTSATRLALAEKLGAHAVPLVPSASWYRDGKSLWPEGYPITVDVSGTTAGLRYALGALSPGGTCSAAGFYLRRGTPLPLWQMYMKSVTLRGPGQSGQFDFGGEGFRKRGVRVAESASKHRRFVDVLHGHPDGRVARDGEQPGERLASNGPVREAGVAEPMKDERRAVRIVSEELLPVAPGGDEVLAHQLGAVLGRRDPEEGFAFLGLLDERGLWVPPSRPARPVAAPQGRWCHGIRTRASPPGAGRRRSSPPGCSGRSDHERDRP
jgi:threonine dehydrogenase-like Zn-dependent dehydrogenase